MITFAHSHQLRTSTVLSCKDSRSCRTTVTQMMSWPRWLCSWPTVNPHGASRIETKYCRTSRGRITMSMSFIMMLYIGVKRTPLSIPLRNIVFTINMFISTKSYTQYGYAINNCDWPFIRGMSWTLLALCEGNPPVDSSQRASYVQLWCFLCC